MTTDSMQGRDVLELDRVQTIRQAAAVKDGMLAALAAADSVALVIPPDCEADLSFVQLVESARIHASLQGKRLHLAKPAEGQVLETLERAGLTTAMSAESRNFWLHEKEIR